VGSFFLIAALLALIAMFASPQWRANARTKRDKVAETAAEAVRRQIEGPKPDGRGAAPAEPDPDADRNDPKTRV
jgi:hypothetical protein